MIFRGGDFRDFSTTCHVVSYRVVVFVFAHYTTERCLASPRGAPQTCPRPLEPRAGVEEAQSSVAEVVGAVRGTVARVLERDGRLAELDQRAEGLQEGSTRLQAQVTSRHSGFSEFFPDHPPVTLKAGSLKCWRLCR